MKNVILGLFVVLSIDTFCSADVTKLPAESRKVLEDSSRFREVHSTTNLPTAVVVLCTDKDGRLAEPGQKWEATDFITDAELPQKRLIWAAIAGEYYVMHYERGGYAHSYHVLVAMFKPGDKKAEVAWHAVGGRLENYKAFLAALESNKLDDTREYAH